MTTLGEEESFFEGAEKLLEIWFLPASGQNTKNADLLWEDKPSLRSIPVGEWDKLLESASCHILHLRSNEYLDSYVLSERFVICCSWISYGRLASYAASY